ncbi:Nbs-lrr resistance protein [Hibiscus syriacus]|uniref:Nbs-lrr resistance protein n=1 Tax=Hibiscus syriacus TaxID=106335 RepID=A0A6A2Y8R1_HIBSY|nr:Nbs-lrr resistance protein [Hibiscus syriacus]
MLRFFNSRIWKQALQLCRISRGVEGWQQELDWDFSQVGLECSEIVLFFNLKFLEFWDLVDESTQAMKEVHTEGHFSGSLVVNDPSTVAVNLPTLEVVGKTTIMKDVHNRLLKGSEFRKLIWVTVSQDFNIRRLQKSVAGQLGENLSDDEDTIVRAGKLSDMLIEQGRYVLILDDVWDGFSLEDVGILKPTSDNGCKLVLTTRSERVVRSMGFKKFQVPCLPMEEAMDLFLSKFGQDMLPNPTLESSMKLIVKECDGLPLAIVTLAGCMRGISDPRLWENAIDELQGNIRNIHDMEDKRCIDHEIKKHELIEYWMEEGLIDEMGSRKAMECSGHSILQKLEENCLLERVEDGMHVKMHDLVRDMALHITRKRFLVKAGMLLEEVPNEEEWCEDLEKVSLMHNSISAVPRTMKGTPKFPKITTLLLSHNSLKEIPESFFEHFPNLKILDLSHNPIKSLPNSVSGLEKLTALLLNGCCELESLPCVVKLQALRKLDLRSSGVREMPEGLGMLVNLRYLDLGYTRCLKEIATGLLSKLRRLQYLAIHSILQNAEEMSELNKLEAFEGGFSNVGYLNMYAGQRKELYKYSILVCPQNKPRSFVQYSRSSSRNSVRFESIEINSGAAIVLPYQLQQLHFNHCKGVTSLNEVGLRDGTDLKVCELVRCDELESVFSSNCDQLRTLEYLTLTHLWNLKVLAGVEESSMGIFSSLKEIVLSGCHKIKQLLSSDWVLHNLEKIDVTLCWELEEIVTGSETEFSFPKLRRLRLCSLLGLKSICSENGVMVCESLQFIEIIDCPKLKRIPLYLPQLKVDDEGKLSSANSLEEICFNEMDWWNSVEWAHPHFNVKNVLRPLLKFRPWIEFLNYKFIEPQW